MLNELTRLCTGDHKRGHLLGGKAKQAENYPLDLILAILRGMDRTTKALKSVNIALEADWGAVMKQAVETAPGIPDNPDALTPPSSLPLAARREMQITYDPHEFSQGLFR